MGFGKIIIRLDPCLGMGKKTFFLILFKTSRKKQKQHFFFSFFYSDFWCFFLMKNVYKLYKLISSFYILSNMMNTSSYFTINNFLFQLICFYSNLFWSMTHEPKVSLQNNIQGNDWIIFIESYSYYRSLYWHNTAHILTASQYSSCNKLNHTFIH